MALIVVVLMLAAMAAVGVPFLLSSGLERRESRLFAARARARHAAEGALARALWCLTRTSEAAERAGYYGQPWDTPDWDTLAELKVTFAFSRPPQLKDEKKPPPWRAALEDSSIFHNPRGEIWTAKVEDEQGKINVNSASPALLGNLLGSAILAAPVPSNDLAPVIQVGDTYYFPADDDDKTIDGFVRIGREILAYTSKTETTLEGVTRAQFGTEADNHGAGALVCDARGWAVSALRMRGTRGGGAPTGFGGVSAIKGISAFGVSYGGRNYTLALGPADYESIERYLTSGSYRPKADGWVRREKLLNPSWEADARRFRLKDNSNYGPGTVVRFLDDTGRVRGYGRVLSAQYLSTPSTRGARITLEYGVGFRHPGGSEFFIETEQPHAINVNTARVPVLAACMTGVALRGGQGVDPDQARLVAQKLVSSVIRNKDDLNIALTAVRDQGHITENQRRAILENATVPGSTLLRVTTAPFCYRAYNLFTVEASGIVNHPASGRPMAVHTIRQLVQMPTAWPGTFLVRSQKEFEEQMRAGVGKLVVSWPVALVNKNAAPNESINENIGDLRLGTGRAGKVLPGTVLTDHYEKPVRGARLTPDGLSLRGGRGQSYSSRTCFRRSNGSVTPGSLEVWVRADSWGGSIFRAGAGTRNLIDVSYDSRQGELVMELGDGTREGRTVVYRQPYNLDTKTWYHIKAIYKSTRLGGQAFEVDGGQVVPQGAGDYFPGTTLTGDLDDWSTPPGVREVNVDSTSEFASRGAFIIGSEIFEYDGKNATTFLKVKRGRRYTQATDHSRGAPVQIYGYSVRVRSTIPKVSGRVADDIGANPRCRIANPADPGPPPVAGGIDDTQTDIPVDGTSDFQSSGYIWVGRECIYYGRKTATKFLSCRRGQRSTKAAKHNDRRTISQASLLVTNYSGYPDSGYVQIDDSRNRDRVEWIYYYEKLTVNGKRYMLPRVYTDSKGRKYLGSWRSRYGTGYRPHVKGAKLLPVFELRGPQCGNASSPQYEPVTVTDSSGNSEARRLKRVYEGTWPNYTGTIPRRFTGWSHAWRAAFDDYTSRSYSGSQLRLLKFPSGELAISLPNLRVGRNFRGDIDELRVASGHSVAGFLPLDLTLKPTDAGVVIQMPSTSAANAVPQAGLARLGDEMIYYTGRSVSTRRLPFTPRIPFQLKKSDPEDYHRRDDFPVVRLSGVRRAVLGSNSDLHAPGSPATFLEAVPVTDLRTATDKTLNSVQLRSTGGFEAEGYALVGSEIVGYTRKTRGTLDGTYFRGAFGTDAQAHPVGTLALPLPFRYWDRYLPESDRSEMAYFQGSYSAAGTRWNRIGMVLARTAHMRVRLQVRFDGAPGWDSTPTNREGELYEFAGPGPHDLRTAAGRQVRADQIEYRVLFNYRSGAHQGDGWKQTPRIDTLYIEYGNPLVVIRREVSTQ